MKMVVTSCFVLAFVSLTLAEPDLNYGDDQPFLSPQDLFDRLRAQQSNQMESATNPSPDYPYVEETDSQAATTALPMKKREGDQDLNQYDEWWDTILKSAFDMEDKTTVRPAAIGPRSIYARSDGPRTGGLTNEGGSAFNSFRYDHKQCVLTNVQILDCRVGVLHTGGLPIFYDGMSLFRTGALERLCQCPPPYVSLDCPPVITTMTRMIQKQCLFL